MRYNPKDAFICLPAGDYEATIHDAEERVSSNNNEMIVFSFMVYRDNTKAIVRDYITESMIWKLKKIAKAIGQLEVFEGGVFRPEDYKGRNLTVTLGVEESEDYGDQNRIRGYQTLQRQTSVASKERAVGTEITDDDIPF